MSKHGKTYTEARQRYDREREYQPAEAIALVKSVEVHVRTGLNVRHADEQLRGTIALPNGLGKEVKVAVFAQGDKAREAEEAGADVVGGEDLAKRILEDGFDDFDVAIATPDLMPIVGRLGRDRPPGDRQARLRGARAARELRGRDRGADPSQAVGGQGPLHPFGDARLDHGPRDQRRPVTHPRHR